LHWPVEIAAESRRNAKLCATRARHHPARSTASFGWIIPGAPERSSKAPSELVYPTMHILTYHAGLIDGPSYDQNDHVALREDLKRIAGLGLRVVPLQWVVDAVLGRRDWRSLDNAVALTCDDGTAFDALPGREYGTLGPQPSLLSVLQDWIDECPADRAEAN